MATQYDLDGLLIQVSINGNALFAPGAAYVVDPGAAGVQLKSKGSRDQPFGTSFDIHLKAPVSIKGGSVVLSSPVDGCSAPDKSIPANVTFYRNPKLMLAGLPFDPVRVTTQPVSTKPGPYAFDVDLVSDGDTYDVYIEPIPTPTCTTPIPPYFVAAWSVSADTAFWTLDPAANITGPIAVTDPSKWQVDFVEPRRGLRISTPKTSLQFVVGTLEPQVSAFTPPLDPANLPICRLLPVDSSGTVVSTLPTIYWSMQDAYTGTTSAPVLKGFVNDFTASAVDVWGHIVRPPDDVTGVSADLTFQYLGDQNFNVGKQSSFSLMNLANSPAPGQFHVLLPPGDYNVRAVPIGNDDLSITDNPLQWPAAGPMGGCVCGKTFPLASKATFSGVVQTATGVPLAAATVGVAASEAPPQDFLWNAFHVSPLPARTVTGSTDGNGNFSLNLDLGTSDLTVAPDPSTNFPWLVSPGFTPKQNAQRAPFKLTNPAFLTGIVKDPQGNPVPDAQIDAWYPVRDPSQPSGLAGTVVKIATTTTDANGAYTLVLPSSI